VRSPAPAPAPAGKVGRASSAAAPGFAPAGSERTNWNCIHCIPDWDRGNLYALRAGDEVVQGEKYCGIGVLLKECVNDARKTRVAYIQFGSPAHFSGGLAVEDTILDIDGIPCCTLQQAAERIMGAAGTLVRLRIRRCRDGGIQTVTLLRQVAFPSVLYQEKDVVGLGVVVSASKRDPHPRVVEIMPGSSTLLPAIEGVKLHDRVSVVNGKDVRNIDVAKTAKMIKGPRFSRVDMQIERDGVPHSLFLVRGELLSGEWMALAEAYEKEINRVKAAEEAKKPIAVPTVYQVMTALQDDAKASGEDKKGPGGVPSEARKVPSTAAR